MRASAALVLLVVSGAACAQPLGTLFHSARERDLLERQRRGENVESRGEVVIERRDPVITGYVKRSDGKSTVFLDKRPYRTTNPRIQRQLEPRMVERYVAPEPEPAPANAVPPAAESDKGKPAPGAEAARTKPATAPSIRPSGEI